MQSENNIEKTVYERRWEFAVSSGRTQLGNLQVNLDFLEQTNLINPSRSILELGCGSGNIAATLQSKGIAIIASDISQAAVDHANKLHPEVDFRTHSADELPYDDQSFDIVMSFDVFEHLPDVDKHLRQVRRVLKPDGYYLLQTPNKLSNSIFETLKCRSMEWKQYHPSLHFHGQLKRRFKRCGFNPTFVKMNTMNEYAVNKFKRLGLPGWLFSWINFRYLPFWLQTNFYLMAQKVTD